MKRSGGVWVVLLAVVALGAPSRGQDGESETAAALERERAERLRGIRQEIQRLEQELGALSDRERGVLAELQRLDVQLDLRQKEFDEKSLYLEQLVAQVDASSARLADLQAGQERRRDYLVARLRQLYRAGPRQALRGFLGGNEADDYWAGLRYASLLSERDSRVLGDFHAAEETLSEEHRALEERRSEVAATVESLERARDQVAATRRRRARTLNGIREDKQLRENALTELAEAADRLTDVVDGLRDASPGEAFDIRKFKGLLDWPSSGRVSAGFGTVIHPRFKTRIPHPGLDIEGAAGTDIRSVFEGVVVFSAWMRGYGLTAIVDHGGGLLSIYAHASVLIVEPGERVTRGQLLGKIGETGSLRGPYLYFELRVDGKAVEPTAWLRPRR